MPIIANSARQRNFPKPEFHGVARTCPCCGGLFPSPRNHCVAAFPALATTSVEQHSFAQPHPYSDADLDDPAQESIAVPRQNRAKRECVWEPLSGQQRRLSTERNNPYYVARQRRTAPRRPDCS